MSRKDAADPRSSMWGLIGFYLRFLRTSKGLTGPDAAKIAGCAPSTISRIETGEQRMSDKHAERLDKAWKTGGLFGLLIYYARRASDPDWFESFLAQEQEANRIRMFAGQHVPGLLQTPDYARALLDAGRAKDKEASHKRRMARQKVLDRANPPELWVLLAQNVLEWPVGGRDVHRGQLALLLKLSELPHVSIRIVPTTAGANEGLDGPFMILTGGNDELAFVEAPNAGRLVSEVDEVRDFLTRFDRIGMLALPIGASRELIKKIMEQMT
ncbi:helix-turn-helix transcriptional regulator [Actinomadura viridis]|uniref:Transcriptional regulator with XRE-family HTH domain n=1 Tax=Actinomadura viridis TaxID=58110 RepID=A0A931DTK3_9ACTN|nr:helix-turn-helix transcriptional regulator [Actinomadura viridis]MBG6093661.1 transcriptional regulator with XRE-family HTH domain [Actinomadura viridis]